MTSLPYRFQVQPDWQRGCNPYLYNSPHTGGMNVTLGDGSVRFLSPNISPTTWGNAINPRDGLAMGLMALPQVVREMFGDRRQHAAISQGDVHAAPVCGELYR